MHCSNTGARGDVPVQREKEVSDIIRNHRAGSSSERPALDLFYTIF